MNMHTKMLQYICSIYDYIIKINKQQKKFHVHNHTFVVLVNAWTIFSTYGFMINVVKEFMVKASVELLKSLL